MMLGTLVLPVLALYIFQLFMQELSGWGRDPGALLRPRDEPPARATLAVRLVRARDNLREALPLFLGLTILAFATGDPRCLVRRSSLRRACFTCRPMQAACRRCAR